MELAHELVSFASIALMQKQADDQAAAAATKHTHPLLGFDYSGMPRWSDYTLYILMTVIVV